MRDFFNQSNGVNVPSYVDRIAEDYETGIEAGDLDLPWMGDDLAAGEGRKGGVLGGLWRMGGRVAPARRGAAHDVPLTKSFLNVYGSLVSNPAGFAAKLVSLTAVPGFYAAAWYLFFRFFMGWGERSSLAVVLFVFFFVLRDSILSLGDRPSFLEVIRLFMHEAALVWLMWVFASMAYTVCVHRWGAPYFLGTFVGLVVAGCTYFLSMSHVGRRTGASGMARYMTQVTAVVVTTAVGLGAGYALAPLLWQPLLKEACPPYGNYLASMLFAFAAFWIGVNQFYIQTGRSGAASQLERGWDVEAEAA